MIRELRNVPEFWTVLFHGMACIIYVILLPRRRKLWQCAVIAAALFAVQFPYVCFVAPLDGVAFIWGMHGFMVLTSLPFHLMCKGSLCNHVYYCARAFIWGGFAVSLSWQLYTYYSRRAEWLATPLAEAGFMLLHGTVIFFVMYFLEWIHRSEIREMSIPLRSCLGAAFIALIVWILNGQSYNSVESPFTTTIEVEAFNIRTLVYLGGVAILYAYHLQICDSYAMREIDALQNVLNMQYANYRRSQESIDMINRKYHDLKHLIAVLRSEIVAEQKLDLLDQVEREIRAYESQNQTDNKVLDVILTEKNVYCLEHSISLICKADGSALDFMGVMDVSALFGNVLDNAIEGVSRLSDPEQRLIRLSVTRQKGFLRIKAENRCEDVLVVEGELPKTTKQDKGQHGYGLKSIRATVEKYSGSVTLQAKNGWFTLGILIPLPTGSSSQAVE